MENPLTIQPNPAIMAGEVGASFLTADNLADSPELFRPVEVARANR
jgi:hypothetical protein